MDHSDFSFPLVTFNTSNLQVYCFNEKLRDFQQLRFIDTENFAKNDMPRFFKTVYIPDDKFFIIGGLERQTSQSSAKAYIIDEKGKLSLS